MILLEYFSLGIEENEKKKKEVKYALFVYLRENMFILGNERM